MLHFSTANRKKNTHQVRRIAFLFPLSPAGNVLGLDDDSGRESGIRCNGHSYQDSSKGGLRFLPLVWNRRHARFPSCNAHAQISYDLGLKKNIHQPEFLAIPITYHVRAVTALYGMDPDDHAQLQASIAEAPE